MEREILRYYFRYIGEPLKVYTCSKLLPKVRRGIPYFLYFSNPFGVT